MLAALLGLALLGASFAASAQAFDPSRFIPLSVTVLRIEARGVNGRLNVGTAITVAPGVVVTNCHVTRDATSIRVAKRAGQWQATGQYADAEHDLCFLTVPAWRGMPVTFADGEPLHLYQPVVAMGFTRGVDMSVTGGEITGLHGHDGGHIIQSTSSFSSGASGGALLDSQGRLIGVLTFRLKGNRDHYFSIPAVWVAGHLPISADSFRPIGPLPQLRAFWEGDSCCLPYFMRVASLESQAKWPDLLHMAEEWLAADPGDADAWFAKGMAQARMRQAADAVNALTRSTELAPRHANAWFELGAATLQHRDVTGARRALAALTDLNSELAAELARSISETRSE